MVYDGGIQFINKDIPFGEVEWIDNLQFGSKGEHALVAKVGEFRDGMRRNGKYTVLDPRDEERGWIQYDVKGKDEESKDLCEERCVVGWKEVDRVAERYCILVVKVTNDG